MLWDALESGVAGKVCAARLYDLNDLNKNL